MITKALKQGLTLAVVMSFLVGCSSSDSNKTEAPTTGTAVTDTSASEATLSNVVYFDFDQYSLTAESRAVLLAHADKLKGASVAVRLEGHADERGSREYNMALGEKRANAVRDFLVTQGVNGSSLEVVSFGEEQPVATGSDEASWAQNRRVEVKY
ncbi:MAG TPA: peptidoglycan-associated lipoprotein Pal [Cellvibrio sp.]|jgi:peptidoglycan-associated lipoprotein|nr:peptidoglycan-associated lipoprotein Pal [Cellvibrio sp.]